jgi:Zn-dependent protease with chaperone function
VSFDPRLPRDDVNASRTHPLAEAWWLVVGAAAAGVALALLALALAEAAARWLPPTLEARLFGGLVAEEGEHPRADAARALLARLAGHWPENPYALRLSILDEEDPNAFAMPGDSITVTRGLLEQVESENELAFVLAHEIGHFAGRDHLQAIGRALVLSLTLQAVFGSVGAETVPTIASNLASRGYDRGQERAADRFPAAAREMTRGRRGRLLRAAPTRRPARHARLVRHHPVSEKRIAALHAHARRNGWPAAGPSPPP